MTKKTEDRGNRRDFLKLAGASAPAAVVALSATGAEAATETAVDLASETMQDTAHTRAYFDSARF